MATTHKTNFQPNPEQKKFIESRAAADLFSSRFGEGKSTAGCWASLYHTRHNPGARWAIIRDTYENLRDTTMKTFFEWFPPGIYGSFNKGEKTFKWAEGIGRGEVVFLGMDDSQDANKLMSRELAGFFIDEPAPALGVGGVSRDVFDMAMGRLRQTGMQWHAAKLAENNPDEAHWTYKMFVSPGTEDYMVWQPLIPENIANLPPNYYNKLRSLYSHREDLVRRFVDGEFGFQRVGKSVTPQWNDRIHLATGLSPIPRADLFCLWDFGLNPTCILTQVTPLRAWHILDAIVGEDCGVEELIDQRVKPLLIDKYRDHKVVLRHIGDPNGVMREQSSANRSAVRSLKQLLGGTWRAGPVQRKERVQPLQAVLSKLVGGRGMVQVDRLSAPAVWHSLRGGWHYHVARSGVTAAEPAKDIHSHPGDAMGYGAAVLFPLGRIQRRPETVDTTPSGGYFGSGMTSVPTSGGDRAVRPEATTPAADRFFKRRPIGE